MSGRHFMIPSIEQRKSQINLLNFMEKDRRDSKEFLFPDENLFRRRKSADQSATQSEDEEFSLFEVSYSDLVV